MKHLLKPSLLLLLLAIHLTTTAQWRSKASEQYLHNCTAFFPSAKTGYILNSPNLKYTQDSGKTWQWARLPSSQNMFDVFFINDSTGWVAGGNFPDGVIYRTHDGGKTWATQKSIIRQILKVSFIDEMQGWAVGNENSYSAIYHTEDGGNEWTVQYSGSHILRTVQFISPEIGWAAGDNGNILSTRDSGHHWAESTTGEVIHYRALCATSADTAWIGGGYQYGALFQTSNGGKKWQLIENNTLAHISCISFLNKKEGWLAGDRGVIMYTPDGGKTWLQQPTSSREDIKYIRFFSSNFGVAVGVKGTVFYYP